jgi:hypothetical protein
VAIIFFLEREEDGDLCSRREWRWNRKIDRGGSLFEKRMEME